jgi:hypothetical protein
MLRQLAHFNDSDHAYGKGVADKLGIDVKEIEKYAKMNLKEMIDAISEEGYKK